MKRPQWTNSPARRRALRGRRSSPPSAKPCGEIDWTRAYLDVAGVILVALDRDGRIGLINKKGCQVLGRAEHDLVGKSWFETCLPATVRESVREVFGRLMAGEIEPVEYYENPVLTASGEERIIAWHNALLKDGNGCICGVLSSGEDISERKRAEEALRKSEERLRKRNRELLLLHQASRAFNSTLDLDLVLVSILEEVRRLMSIAACSVWLIEPETGKLVCRQASGPKSELVLGWRLAPGEGLAGWVAQTGESLVVADVLNDPRHFAGVDRRTGLPLRSILSVPLRARERVIGVLQMVDVQVGRFDKADIELVELLAASAAAAIENARLYDELRRRSEELAALNAIAITAGRSPNRERMLQDVLDAVVRLDLTAGRGAIFLLDERTGQLSVAAQCGFPDDHPCLAHPVGLGECLCGQAAQRGEIVLANGPDQDGCHVRRWAAPFHREVCVPLKARGRVMGVMTLELPVGRDIDSGIGLLKAIGDQVSLAIENTRLMEEASEIEVLQELNRLRSELIANVSHELRTPLGLIKVFCTTLLREDAEFDRQTQLELLRDIDEEAERLEKIVDNLLDLSRMESGRLRLEICHADMRQLAAEAMRALEVEAQAARCRLVSDFPPEPLEAMVDARRIEQVLRNLLSNAIKYSPNGGTITVRGRGDEWQVLVSVSDEGVGIPPQDLERVFERFYRVENEATRQVSGAGLGLAVCKGIVEAHGGRIWAESAGKGSTFFFTLKRRQEP